MRVRVRLYAALAAYRPPSASGTGAFELEVAEGDSIGALIERLGVPAALARVCAVNGEIVDRSAVLAPGDEVALLPAASGGGW